LAGGKHDIPASSQQFSVWYTRVIGCAAILLLGLMLSLAPPVNRQTRRAAALQEASWVGSELPRLQLAFKTRTGRYASSMKEIDVTAWDWAPDSVRRSNASGILLLQIAII
jgi:hypothetical protein